MYEECGNESWSVELKPQSLYEGDDAYYVTLLDVNTLLLQHFYTMDGIRFVNYETYIRGSEMMEAVRLTEEANPDTIMLLCSEYVKLKVIWNGEVIHETELGHRNTELLLLKIPQENGICQFTFTPDFENWYTLDISREIFDMPKWISLLDPG